MKTVFKGQFNPGNRLQVERLLTAVSERRFADKPGGQIRAESVDDPPEGVLIYKIHAENGVYVVRFSLVDWKDELFENEARIAREICPLTRIEVPQTVFFPADGGIPSFTIHQWIIGEPLTTEMYLAMSAKCKRLLLDDLTEFMLAVHSIDIQATASWNGWSGWDPAARDFGKPKWFGQTLRERIRILLSNRLKPEPASAAIATIDAFEQLTVEPADMAFVHGDIHGFNLAMRSGTFGYALGGIFDLENAGVLDVHEDFFRLYFISPELVDRTINAYNEKSTNRKPLDGERINLYWRAFLLYLMMENLEPGEDAGFRLYENLFTNTIKARR